MQNSVSTSWGRTLCRSTTRETSCTKEEDSSNTVYARKIDDYDSPRFRLHESGKQKHEQHIADHGYKSSLQLQ